MAKKKTKIKEEIVNTIVGLIAGRKKGAKFAYLALQLKQKHNIQDKKVLRNILTFLILEGKIITQGKRYFINDKSNYKIGRFMAAKGGFGFVIPEDGEEDIFIPPKKTNSAITGDIVKVFTMKGKNGTEGEIVSIVERKYKSIIGYFNLDRLNPTIIPLDTKITEEIEVRSLKGVSVVPGMIVEGDIKEKRDGIYVDRIKRVFGFPDDEGVDLNVIIEKYGFDEEFPNKVKTYVDKISEEISSEIKKRKDFI